ncbi:unnamed protein product [Moneuplotes crassus]|uniref:Uncharacterized protein n=1 Tax=Euplotes crassus TaxID=5936 RepID=A0AAD1XSP8_EUPCR|nr:unnamed protein product [Moneuplotes crassus]
MGLHCLNLRVLRVVIGSKGISRVWRGIWQLMKVSFSKCLQHTSVLEISFGPNIVLFKVSLRERKHKALDAFLRKRLNPMFLLSKNLRFTSSNFVHCLGYSSCINLAYLLDSFLQYGFRYISSILINLIFNLSIFCTNSLLV